MVGVFFGYFFIQKTIGFFFISSINIEIRLVLQWTPFYYLYYFIYDYVLLAVINTLTSLNIDTLTPHISGWQLI